MDKQLNARVKPELHNQIKQLSTDSRIIMNTLVETLLEIGLKHYYDNNVAIDSKEYITKDDLITFESELLKKVESLIANSGSGQAVVNSAIAIPETKHNQLDLTDIPTSQAIAVSPVADLDHLYPIGTEIKLKDLAEYLGFNRVNYSTNAKRKGISLEDYINEFAIAKGEVWKRVEHSQNNVTGIRVK